ncbi:FAD-binding protein [Rhodococcus sp. 1.20]
MRVQRRSSGFRGRCAVGLRLQPRAARIAVREKANRLSSTSAYSSGALWLPETSVHERADVEDSMAASRSYLRAVIGDCETRASGKLRVHRADCGGSSGRRPEHRVSG